MPLGTAREIAFAGRNDLELPALQICPVIGEVLDRLRQTKATLVRMSGSGATCFALFGSAEDRDQAQQDMPADWWTLTGALR